MVSAPDGVWYTFTDIVSTVDGMKYVVTDLVQTLGVW